MLTTLLNIYTSFYLIIRSSEPTSDIFVIKNLNLECEIFLHVLDDHDKIRQLDAQGLLSVSWACNIGRADIRTDYFQYKRLNGK